MWIQKIKFSIESNDSIEWKIWSRILIHPRGVEGAHDFLGNSANTDLICQAKGGPGQAPVSTHTLETNEWKIEEQFKSLFLAFNFRVNFKVDFMADFRVDFRVDFRIDFRIKFRINFRVNFGVNFRCDFKGDFLVNSIDNSSL